MNHHRATPLAPSWADAGAATVAVTGASGFIGARLVALLEETLLKEAGRSGIAPLRPRVFARRGRAVPGQERRTVDLRDAAALDAALEGCRAAVHCAFDFADLWANLAIAQALGSACALAGIRLVHVSTAAVYEPFPNGTLDETGSRDGASSDYKQVKRAIEDSLLRMSREDGLDLVILQPTIVYGPGGRAWTDSPVRALLTGTLVLPDEGRGLCNAVYVDDVCHAAIAAIAAHVLSGERFLVSAAAPVTWLEFYGAYQAMLGVEALELAPTEDDAAAAPAEPSGRAGLKRVATQLLGARLLARLGLVLRTAKSLVRPARHVPAGPMRDLLRARCTADIAKARRLLGYAPQFDLAAGMRMTEPYVRASYATLARLALARLALAPRPRRR